MYIKHTQSPLNLECVCRRLTTEGRMPARLDCQSCLHKTCLSCLGREHLPHWDGVYSRPDQGSCLTGSTHAFTYVCTKKCLVWSANYNHTYGAAMVSCQASTVQCSRQVSAWRPRLHHANDDEHTSVNRCAKPAAHSAGTHLAHAICHRP